MKLISILLITFLFYSCVDKFNKKSKIENGIYCADVYYYRHKNGKRVDLTIPVLIENNHLVKFEDEWVKNIIFEPQEIVNDTVTFTTVKDEFIGVLLLGKKSCKEYQNFDNEE